jgi:flagellar secretion chaperone FliS
MMQRKAPWQSYRKVTTQTATPENLVLMLYDGAIRFLEKGLTGFEFTDPLRFNLTINNNVLRAQAIIYELNARLDMEKGGEAAHTFRRLYDYFYRRLQEANFKKKKSPIEEVIRHLTVLRESWSEMLRRGPGRENEPALEGGFEGISA